MKSITIQITEHACGKVSVHSSFLPGIGHPLSPAQALALELINVAAHASGQHVMPLVKHDPVPESQATV